MSKNHLKQQNTGDSNPPDSSNNFITNPSAYESGYLSLSSKDCTGYNQSYYLLSDFTSGGVCAPTAATNLCNYWYFRNSSKYGKLRNPNTGFTGTLSSFYKLMKTNKVNDTEDSNVASAYVNYFKQVGLSCTASLHYGTDSGRNIINEINNNRPCHLMLHNNYTYNGDHSVLALGYKQYSYNFRQIVKTSNYIRIADGWDSYPERYVWGGYHGEWNYVTVIPS